MFAFILLLAQIIVSVLLITVILMQQKGAGLGGAFGGSGAVYSSKRGFDNVLYKTTIVLSILFLIISLAAVIVV